MFDAWRKEHWDRTAALLAVLIACHRDPSKGAAPTVLDLNPYRAAETVGRGTGTPYTIDVFRRRHQQWLERQERERVIRPS